MDRIGGNYNPLCATFLLAHLIHSTAGGFANHTRILSTAHPPANACALRFAICPQGVVKFAECDILPPLVHLGTNQNLGSVIKRLQEITRIGGGETHRFALNVKLQYPTRHPLCATSGHRTNWHTKPPLVCRGCYLIGNQRSGGVTVLTTIHRHPSCLPVIIRPILNSESLLRINKDLLLRMCQFTNWHTTRGHLPL